MRSSLLVVVALWGGCTGSNHALSERHKRNPAENAAHTADERPSEWTIESLADQAKLLGNLGKVHRTVSHREREAQELFDQGLALMYAFNYDEAVRSFARAAEIDPTCALCFWGISYALGPNYNRPYLEERAALAWEALKAAESIAGSAASPVEQALIAALAKRCGGSTWPKGRMEPHKQAYAQAMAKVAEQFPDDFDVQTLYAEALMQLRPYRLYTPEGEPTGSTEQIVQILERVLKYASSHAGANHLYIHAVEASRMPERALASAGRLPGLVPGVGHVVHKPSRIYQRVGRYADAAEANRHAIETDLAYLARHRPHGDSRAHLSHSYGYLAFAASMLGRREEASEAALSAVQEASDASVERSSHLPGRDFLRAAPLLVWVRFGMWDEIEKQAKPSEKLPVQLGMWHHARGMACAAKGDWERAIEHSAVIRKLRIVGSAAPEDVAALTQRLGLAAKIVDARAAEVARNPGALALWQEAVALEDALPYSEPDDWFYPVRHYYGAALLDAGKAEDAEAVFRKDLEAHPHNGWALYGLSRALAKQKKTKPAKEAEQAYKDAFKLADTQLARSAF